VWGQLTKLFASVYAKVRSAIRHLEVFVLGQVTNFIVTVKALELQVLNFPHHAAPESNLESNPVRGLRYAILTKNRVAPPTF